MEHLQFEKKQYQGRKIVASKMQKKKGLEGNTSKCLYWVSLDVEIEDDLIFFHSMFYSSQIHHNDH